VPAQSFAIHLAFDRISVATDFSGLNIAAYFLPQSNTQLSPITLLSFLRV
jgi:hypothetical protein